jgi:hypothetical protein
MLDDHWRESIVAVAERFHRRTLPTARQTGQGGPLDVTSPQQPIERAAAANDKAVGELGARRVRKCLDHGSEDVWPDLVGAMAGSSQPGAAAIEWILARAFLAECRAHQPNGSIA